MPDLSANAVKNWLSQTDPNGLSELPDALRRAELEPSVETALVALGIALDDADAGDPRRLSKRLQTDPARSAFQSVLAQLGSARLLRLLDWLSEPGKSSRHSLLTALFTPGAGDASQAVQSSIQFLTRRSLIDRMTASERMDTLVTCTSLSRQRKAARKVI
jgi:hypothetical protein